MYIQMKEGKATQYKNGEKNCNSHFEQVNIS